MSSKEYARPVVTVLAGTLAFLTASVAVADPAPSANIGVQPISASLAYPPNQSAGAEAEPVAVPLPSAASTGLVMLAAMAGWRGLRRLAAAR